MIGRPPRPPLFPYPTLFVSRPPAEGDAPAAAVADREHDPAAEAVIAGAAALGPDQQPGLEQQLLGQAGGGERRLERAAAIRREAQPEAGDGLVVEAAPLQVVERGAAAGRDQLLLEPARRRLERAQQRRLA